MTREEVLRRTYYSYFIETMQATLLGRVDRVLTFLQLLLGSAVFASLGNSFFLGALIATISAISFVWQPAKSALVCEIQAKKMKKLLSSYEKLDDDAFYQEYIKNEDSDSPVIGALRDPALKRAYIVIDNKDEARKINLTPYQRFVSHLSGDCPVDE